MTKEYKNLKILRIHGEDYYTTFTKKFEQRKNWEKPNEKILISVIPGTIIEVCVEVGSKIKKGDKLLRLEAMKMQNSIYSFMDGTIKEINVKLGDKVPKGKKLIEIE